MFSNIFTDSVKKSYDQQLKVEGDLPSSLSGDLFRIGPGQYRAGVCSLRHWFDGFSHVVRLNFKNGQVRYKNAFLQTQALTQSRKKNRNAGLMFATMPTTLKHYFDSVVSVLLSLLFIPVKPKSYYDNCNVNIMPAKSGNYIALTEVTKYVEFDSEINTIGDYSYKDKVTGVTTTAHPFIKKGVVYNVLQQYSLLSLLKIVRHNVDSDQRQVIARLWRFFPAYFHTFSATKNYIVLIEPPLRLLLPLLVVLMPFIPFLRFYSWLPFLGTKITVVEKKTGKVKLVKKIEPFFFFHTTNAYEENGKIILELPRSKTPILMKKYFYLNNLKKDPKVSVADYSYIQLKVDLEKKTISQKNIVDNFFTELQSTNSDCRQVPHRFVFGIGNPLHSKNSKSKDGGASDTAHLSNFFSGLVKLNVADGSIKTFCDQCCYYGEPVFVSNKTKTDKRLDEDDGILLSLSYNYKSNVSSVVGVDAKTMEKKFQANIPHVVPLGFHGHFIERPANHEIA